MERNLPDATLPDDVLLTEEVEVSGELRARILRQIDQVMAEGRRPIAAEAFTVKPRKKGILFPVLINAVTAVIVALGILGLAYVFRGRQDPAALRSAGFQSAEGRLLEVFRLQSESRLQEQEALALKAQERLRAAEGSLESRLRDRETVLRRAMDVELAGERDRLKARGLAVAEVEARLRALEAERQAALAAEVGRLRAELDLRRLADARSEERLIADRIRASFALTLGSLQEGDAAAARRSLAALKALLSEPVMEANPGLRERRPVDLLLAEALSELLALRSREAQLASASAPATTPVHQATDPALAARLAAAEGELAASRAELTRTQARLAERERQVQGLQRDLRSRSTAADSETSRLASQLGAATTRADAMAQQLRAAEEKAGKLVREETFKEVIAFLDYLKGDPAKKEQLTAQLAARARQDPLYATVVREIQILAAGAGLGASASPFKLLGTVSSVTPGKVVVEPLVDLAVKAGARVQIRRASGLASELLVARGTVQQAGGGRITVLLDAAIKTGQVPAAMDAVYVETGD